MVGLNASGAQLLEKLFNPRRIHIALHQLVADEPIAIGCRWVNRKQKGELTLIDFIDTQNPRECMHDPGLVIRREVKAGAIGAAPEANAGLTGAHPEITRETIRHAPHGHAILIDRSDGRGDHSIGVAGVRTEKGRLGAKVMLAAGAAMHADRDEEENRMIEIEINGDALGGREAGGWVLAAVAREGREQVRDLTHLTERLIDSQRERPSPF